MRKIGLGIIGLGYVGGIHLRHSLKLPYVNSVSVSDSSKKALVKARKMGVKRVFTDYKDLLKDPEVDSVVIALPTHLHLECAIQAAEASKHIFLEKPIGRSVEEAKEIISAVKRNSVKLMIGYPLRFNTDFRDLKKQIQRGILGDVEVAHSTFISSGPFLHRAEGHTPIPVPDWWFSNELTGGGALIDLGCHIINLLRWYFGEITDMKSHLTHRFNMELEDEATCLAKFESQTVAVINVGWFSQEYQLGVELFGTVAHASVQHRPSNRFFAATQNLMTGTSQFHWPHLAEMQYFITCLMRDWNPSPSGEDALKDLEAISLAYKNEIHLSDKNS